MRHEVRFSGYGGQGIILSAVILGRAAALYDNKYAVQTQVYGPEARGGASMGQVVIDNAPIRYPEVVDPDIYVIMSQQGFEKYGSRAGKDAVMLLDTDLVRSRPISRYYEIPATTEAKETLGKEIVANIVMIGAVAGLGVLPIDRELFETVIREGMAAERVEANLRAFAIGQAAVA